MKVTNKHEAPLNIAGVDVRPGATVEVNDKTYDAWKTGYAASIWLENGLIVEGKGDGKPTPVKKPDLNTVTTGATGAPAAGQPALGSNEDLANKDDGTSQNNTSDTDTPDPKAVREAKFVKARGLGLNPNANTSNKKLDEMIAEAEANK